MAVVIDRHKFDWPPPSVYTYDDGFHLSQVRDWYGIMINATTDKDHSSTPLCRTIFPMTKVVWHSEVLPRHKVCLVDEANIDTVV